MSVWRVVEGDERLQLGHVLFFDLIPVWETDLSSPFLESAKLSLVLASYGKVTCPFIQSNQSNNSQQFKMPTERKQISWAQLKSPKILPPEFYTPNTAVQCQKKSATRFSKK